ncbi:type IX secretion system protein PorG [Flavobacterium notoginsengisoli]|uniref:type IX secretion system protein PorG n=1 Tax=Flavobacterium notoginsengisoli TaxID=1478199 RepID=UPI00362CBFFD
MKKIFNLLLCFFPLITLNAQINELGVFLGGSNFVGDVGKTTYIAPEKLAFGVLYKWNRSPRHSWRFSYTQSEVSGNDFKSDETGRNQRGYRFDNNVKELSAGLEFNFFDFNLHDYRTKITPYVYSGLNFFIFDNLYRYTTSPNIIYSEKSSSFAIPIILGIKSNITPRFVLGLETGVRYTFTDNIDGSNPNTSSSNILKFGNLNNNDWYVFSGVTLTYTFGKKPCYCAE